MGGEQHRRVREAENYGCEGWVVVGKQHVTEERAD